ncbi:MAG: hypothetical protein ACRDTC_08715 [Pseudonocardiaceae bacterium]
MWWASTIDAWCVRTDRKVSADSLWLFREPAATGPAPELQRGVVTLGRHARRQCFYAIVWDTEHGHVIYVQPLDGTGGDHQDWLAVHAAELIEPRWWADAVIVMPIERGLNFFPAHDDEPLAYVYRLTTRSDDSDSSAEADNGVFGGLRRWFQRAVPELAGPPEPSAQWAGQLDLADIATVVGRPIPLWLDDTQTSANAEQTLSYDRTFTVPDTTTEWPAPQARLTRAIEVNMPGEFPCAFAALAADATEGLAKIRAAHERTPDSGPGWYLVCHPARPAPPIELEQRITGASVVTDLDLIGKELTELRAVEGELDINDPRGDAYTEAITLLEWQLRLRRVHRITHDYPINQSGGRWPLYDDLFTRRTAAGALAQRRHGARTRTSV